MAFSCRCPCDRDQHTSEVVIADANSPRWGDVSRAPWDDKDPTAPKKFEVKLEREEGATFGLTCDAWLDIGAQVLSVQDKGPVDDHNRSAAADEGRAIMENDFITSANDVTGANVVRILQKERSVRLIIVRPWQYNCKITREPVGTWGLKMGFQAECSTILRVKELTPGAVKDYNDSADEFKDSKVQQNDFIYKVNQTSGSGKKILETLKEFETVEFTFFRLTNLQVGEGA